MSQFEKCLNILLREEGGFVDHPSDPGGVTNLGVTLKTWRDYVGAPVTKEDMHDLTADDVLPLYRQRYWEVAMCHKCPPGIDMLLFDAAVNSGPKRAVQWLQRAAGARADGQFGLKTHDAVCRQHPVHLIVAMGAYRLQFLAGLSHFEAFGNGWCRRVLRATLAARRMLDSGLKPR